MLVVFEDDFDVGALVVYEAIIDDHRYRRRIQPRQPRFITRQRIGFLCIAFRLQAAPLEELGAHGATAWSKRVRILPNNGGNNLRCVLAENSDGAATNPSRLFRLRRLPDSTLQNSGWH